ncbi:hypothetical protein K440DRAFT_642199 [Wilcoxina mikolae CBS 423.85]|nr:hypothetical protein K440DRAFT_642199 [Wilcoxina mikolae CBS 423.85]
MKTPLFLLLLLLLPLLHALPSPTTPATHTTSGYIPATPPPDLRRRASSTTNLGWLDPSTCNIGICTLPNYFCTVFKSDGVRANTATGYGYGLGTLLSIDCGLTYQRTTTRNPSWALYAAETNPAKGPGASIIGTPIGTAVAASTTAATQGTTAAAVTAQGGKEQLTPGAIAGIVIGAIAAVVVGVVVVMVVWFKLKRKEGQGGGGEQEVKMPEEDVGPGGYVGEVDGAEVVEMAAGLAGEKPVEMG